MRTRVLQLLFVCISFFYGSSKLHAQNFAINTDGSSANASALLDVKSTDKGVLIPRMSKGQKNSIASPATGLLIFQDAPDSTGFYYYNGSSWLWLATANTITGWSTTGNNGTDSALNFLGTLDNRPLMLRQNNLWMGQLNSRNHTLFIGGGAGQNNSSTYNTGFGDSALYQNTTGFSNTAVGGLSLSSIKTGFNNTALGTAAMYEAVGTGNNLSGNTAVGANSLRKARYYFNTAIGADVLSNDTSGIYNTAMGYGSMSTNINGTYNTSLGGLAMYVAKTGDGNVAVGYGAMNNNDSSNYNTAVGYLSLLNHRRVGNTYNTAVGSFSMEQDTIGYYNTGIGVSAFRMNISGYANTGLGTNAGYYQKRESNTYVGAFAGEGERGPGTNFAVDTGKNNTGIGAYALQRIANGIENTAVGYAALLVDSTGDYNTSVGTRSLYSNLSGSYNSALGQNALRENTASNYNTAIGFNSLYYHKRSGDSYNVAVGASSLEQDSSGFYNVGIGTSAFRYNLTGTSNTGVGTNAGYFQLGSNNTFMGAYSAFGERFPYSLAADTGVNNTGIGVNAMYSLADGDDNVAVGLNALFYDSSGNKNVAIGRSSMSQNSTGDNNIGVGYNALNFNTIGTKNTAIGSNADVSVNNLTNATAIGSNASVSQNNSLVLGSINGVNSATSSTAVGMGTVTPRARLHVVKEGTVPSGLVSSSTALLIENNEALNYMQLLNPSTSDAGIISGTSLTTIRSGIIFTADSSIRFQSGGSVNRMTVDNTGYVGVRTTSPLSYFDVSGSAAYGINTTIGDVTLNELNHTIIILSTTTVGNGDITLPTASTCTRREYVIVNQTAVTKNISSYNSFTGAASTTIPAQSSITVQSISNAWYRTK